MFHRIDFLQSNCAKDKELKNVNDSLKQDTFCRYPFHDLELKLLNCFAHYGNKFDQ